MTLRRRHKTTVNQHTSPEAVEQWLSSVTRVLSGCRVGAKPVNLPVDSGGTNEREEAGSCMSTATEPWTACAVSPRSRSSSFTSGITRGPFPTLDYQKKQIRIFAAYKLNIYSPYFENSLQYTSEPLAAPPGGAMTRDEVKELVEYARHYHITLNPQQEAFGHLHHVLLYDLYADSAEVPHGSVLAPGQPGSLELIEKFTRIGPDAMQYDVTVNDPKTWTRPWTVKQELMRQDEQANRIYYEPRCHEGNFGLPTMLRGARAEERAFARGEGPDPAPAFSRISTIGASAVSQACKRGVTP